MVYVISLPGAVQSLTCTSTSLVGPLLWPINTNQYRPDLFEMISFPLK